MITSDNLSESVKGLYVVPNPKYTQALRAGKNPRWISKTKKIFFDNCFPFGARYWSHMAKSPLPKENIDKCVAFDKEVVLRDYQIAPMQKAEKISGGLIVAPTGSGKTAMSCYLMQKIKAKTLILVHSIEMLKQTKQEIKDFLGYDAGTYFGEKKVLKDVTISTYQSAAKHFDLLNSYGFECLMVDEADIFTSDRYLKFLCNFNAKRYFGFTATNRKEEYDDLIKRGPTLLQRLWGMEVFVKTEQQTEMLKEVVFSDLYEKTYVDEYEIPIPAKEWHLFREKLDNDSERKEKQIEWVLENSDDADTSLVLLDRVQMVEDYAEELRARINMPVYMIHGGVKKKDREEQVKKFKEDGGILVANVKIAGRGFNVPKANKAFVCCPIRGESSLRQLVGRVLRKVVAKESRVYDWVEQSLLGQKRKRKNVYKTYYPKAKIINY